MINPQHVPAHPPRRSSNTLVNLIALQLAFALSGMFLELLGPMLPALSARLSLDDTRSGLLFTALFTASSLGALLVRGNFAHTLAAGLTVTALGAAGLVYATPFSVYALFVIFGLGLGITMTSVTMFASSHFPRRRAATLALLNFSWSGGAAVAPLFVARQLAHHQPQSVFAIAAIASAGGTCLMLLLLRDQGSHNVAGKAARNPVEDASGRSTLSNSPPWGTIAFFATIATLETGIETTIGGWLSTYAQRSGFSSAAHAAATASFFWTAFLIGRGIASLLLLRIGERLVLVTSMLLALAGVTAVLLAATSSALAAGAVLAGLALAAIFPINLALFLARISNPTHAGWMLAISGIGGSILPWLTGVISARTGSLHTGLFVPAVAIALMLGMALAAICNRHGYLKLPS